MTERPRRNGVMRRLRLANPSCWPRSLKTSASRTDWNLLAIVITCWRSIHHSFRGSKGFVGWMNLAKNRRSEEHTSELQSRLHLVCRLLLEKKKKIDS